MEFLHENASIGSLVLKTPECASFFEKLGIDYCCKGNKTLKIVCDEKKLNVAAVIHEIQQVSASGLKKNWEELPLKEIIKDITDTYHAYAREELPRINQLLKKLHMKHGSRYTHVTELLATFEKMKDALLVHMNEEEETVFPLMLQLAANEKAKQEEIQSYISSLDEEHVETGAALERIRKLTNDFTPPPDACVTHVVVLDSLKRLEQNLHEHIHKENHVLFPKVLKNVSKQH